MKSYGAKDAVGRNRVAIPSGTTMPWAPAVGEIFHLEEDMPLSTDPLLPWYSRGTYTFNGTSWDKLSDVPRARQAVAIGAGKFEIGATTKLNDRPSSAGGRHLATVTVTPTSGKATFSGAAAVTLDTDATCTAWLVVFCRGTPVGMAIQHLVPMEPRSLALTFLDLPHSKDPQRYDLYLFSDTATSLYINRCAKGHFDGHGQTALVVAENT